MPSPALLGPGAPVRLKLRLEFSNLDPLGMTPHNAQFLLEKDVNCRLPPSQDNGSAGLILLTRILEVCFNSCARHWQLGNLGDGGIIEVAKEMIEVDTSLEAMVKPSAPPAQFGVRPEVTSCERNSIGPTIGVKSIGR